MYIFTLFHGLAPRVLLCTFCGNWKQKKIEEKIIKKEKLKKNHKEKNGDNHVIYCHVVTNNSNVCSVNKIYMHICYLKIEEIMFVCITKLYCFQINTMFLFVKTKK